LAYSGSGYAERAWYSYENHRVPLARVPGAAFAEDLQDKESKKTLIRRGLRSRPFKGQVGGFLQAHKKDRDAVASRSFLFLFISHFGKILGDGRFVYSCAGICRHIAKPCPDGDIVKITVNCRAELERHGITINFVPVEGRASGRIGL